MIRAFLLFLAAAILSTFTFYGKSEHSLDYILAVPVGIYFILAFFLVIRSKVALPEKLKFAGFSLLIWLVLYSVSYNLLFLFIAPVAGGLGAWLISRLSKQFLDLQYGSPWQIVLTGVLTAVLGVLFIIIVKEMPKETYTIGLKVGVLTGLWQLGVGIQLYKHSKVTV